MGKHIIICFDVNNKNEGLKRNKNINLTLLYDLLMRNRNNNKMAAILVVQSA